MTSKLVISTGVSGSGKSVALDALEDEGYYCIDNLPAVLLEAFFNELIKRPEGMAERVALGLDVRSDPTELGRVPPMLKTLREQGIDCEILFLDAQQDILLQRFSETRRKHPLASGTRSLDETIDLERKLLDPLLNSARLRIDTSRLSLHQLRDMIRERVALREPGKLSLMIESFGFKHGVPRNADLVFDARCLPNPHWEPDLRPLTGRDRAVIDFLKDEPKVNELQDEITGFVQRWLPCFESEGRSYLTIAVGCTGGQHRSVYLVEALADRLRANGLEALVRHRELT